MIKFKLLTLLLVLALNVCVAQNQGYVEYDYYHPRATPLKRFATLSFDSRRSVFKFAKDGYDKLENQVEKEEENGVAGIFYSSDSIGSVYFRDFQTKQLTYRTVPSKLIEAYAITDDWIEIAWEILDDRKKIDKFICRKAIGNFRGRTYTAWYAEEIPVAAGPWKLFGLPGLILEATDSEKMFQAYAKKVVFPVANSIDLIPKNDGKKVSIKEYSTLMDSASKDAMEKLKSKMPKKMAVGFTIIENKDDPRNRKFRDEKVYEWEVN